MSSRSERIPVSDPVPDASAVGGAIPAPVVPEFSFAIGRAMGTVVVTTHGVLDPNSARMLGDALLDLVDHQGNLAVVVDVAALHLSDHMCLVPLAPAASAARRRGGRLTFADPSVAVEWALMLTGLAGMVAVTADGRSRSIVSSPADAAGNGSRRAAMAQHPAGGATTPSATTTTTTNNNNNNNNNTTTTTKGEAQ